MFRRLFGQSKGKMRPKQLLAIVRTFVESDSWDGSRRILRAHPELLAEKAEVLFDRLIKEAHDQDEEEKIPYLLAHRSVLRRSREVGIEEAFAELGCRPEEPVLEEGVVAHPLYDLVKQVLAGGLTLEEAIAQACTPAALARVDDDLLAQQDRYLRGMLDDWHRFQEVRVLAELNRALAQARPAPRYLQALIVATLADALEALTLVSPEQREGILDRQVELYEEALSILETSSQVEPVGHIWIHMGNALVQRYQLRRQMADLQQAVAVFAQGLALADLSAEQARGQAGLGEALLCRFEALGNVDDLNQAIIALEGGLPWAEDALDRVCREAGLGIVLLRRFEATGQLADLERATNLLRKSLALIPVGSADWICAQAGLAQGLQAIWETQEQASARNTAIQTYEELLAVIQPDVFPEQVWAAARSLAKLLFSRKGGGDWRKAADVCAMALAAATNLYTEMLPGAAPPSWPRGVLETVSMQSYALARERDLTTAVEMLETGCTRYLAGVVLGEESVRRIPDVVWRETYQAAWRRVLKSVGEHDRADEARRSLAFARLAEARRDLYHLAKGLFPELFASASLERIQRQGSDIPLVYLAATPMGSLALLVHRDGVEGAWLDISDGDLRALLLRYVAGQSSPRGLGEALAEILPSLEQRIVEPITRALSRTVGDKVLAVTLVPLGSMALLPLHAAFGASDDWVVTYASSAQAIALSGQGIRPDATPWRLTVVGDPAGNCPQVRVEMESVAEVFPARSVRSLRGDEVTRNAVLAAMAEATVAHIAMPARFVLGAPLDSGFPLAGGTQLTLRDILKPASREAFSRLSLFIASAGQTIEIDSPDFATETISLPAGLLQTGVPTIVAAFWPVEPSGRTLLLADFYARLLGENLPPAVALHQAQRWLRDLSYARILEYLEARSKALGGTALGEEGWWQEETRRVRQVVQEGRGEDCPYASSYDWASFFCYGSF